MRFDAYLEDLARAMWDRHASIPWDEFWKGREGKELYLEKAEAARIWLDDSNKLARHGDD